MSSPGNKEHSFPIGRKSQGDLVRESQEGFFLQNVWEGPGTFFRMLIIVK